MNKILVNIVWNDNYGAYSDEVPGCVATESTIDAVKEAFKSAIEFHIEGSDYDELPQCLKEEYELEFELSVSALLHYYDKILTRAALSRITGINQRQLGHYLSGYRNPRKDKREIIIKGLHKIGQELLNVR